MEDGLGVPQECILLASNPRVLILVLVEDGLGAENFNFKVVAVSVLILVLVEDGLGVSVWPLLLLPNAQS